MAPSPLFRSADNGVPLPSGTSTADVPAEGVVTAAETQEKNMSSAGAENVDKSSTQSTCVHDLAHTDAIGGRANEQTTTHGGKLSIKSNYAAGSKRPFRLKFKHQGVCCNKHLFLNPSSPALKNHDVVSQHVMLFGIIIELPSAKNGQHYEINWDITNFRGKLDRSNFNWHIFKIVRNYELLKRA